MRHRGILLTVVTVVMATLCLQAAILHLLGLDHERLAFRSAGRLVPGILA